jgi:hypothetical protein
MGRRAFERRGIAEGFFGPSWSMQHRRALFRFGAKRGMNTYLYAPKDDSYHRERWREPYAKGEWSALLKLIAAAQEHTAAWPAPAKPRARCAIPCLSRLLPEKAGVRS